LTSFSLFSKLSSLSCMYKIWNFKWTMLETRRNFESRLCSRKWCTKETYRFGYGIWRCTELSMWKTHYRMHDEASNKR
jgi:hypothetical protein